MQRFVLAITLTALACVVVNTGEAANPCCFTNPSYVGTCTVVPDQDETCAGVLGYLNNPSSTGKGYCGGTTLRGGWASVECKASTSQADEAQFPRSAGSEATPVNEVAQK